MYICHMYTHTFACMKIRVCMYVYLYRFTCDSFISDTAYLHLCDMLIQLNLYIYLYSFMCVSDNSMGEAHTYVYILFHTCVRRLCRRRYIHSFTRESDGYIGECMLPVFTEALSQSVHVLLFDFSMCDTTHLRVCDTFIHVTSRVCIYSFMCVRRLHRRSYAACVHRGFRPVCARTVNLRQVCLQIYIYI